MAKATIKSKKGLAITIEGNDREVARILQILEHGDSVAQGRKMATNVKVSHSRRDERKRSATSDLIIGLKDEGFFNKARGLSDIASSLEEKGYIYPVTTLSGVMLGLVQKKLLGRKKVEGRWVYGK